MSCSCYCQNVLAPPGNHSYTLGLVKDVRITGGAILWTPPDRRVSGYVVVYYKEGEESRNEKETTEPYLDFTEILDGSYLVEVKYTILIF